MAAPEYREIWVPLENSTDCSQGFCTIYCPQWCYIIFPPPPPFGFDSGQDDSGTSFSPLVIAIIGILASAVLLVSYYTVVSRYCGNWNSMRGHLRRNHRESFNEDHHVSAGESWQIPNSGLEESLIKSITVCKFKRGEGLIEGTDCSVCLSEFQEDESLRLLPKCSHAFHLPCIDRWLQDNSSCPLCRASVVSHILAIPITQMPSTLPEFEIMMSHESLPAENHSPENSSLADVHTEEDVGISGGSGENDSIVTSEIVDDDQSSTGPKISLRAFSDLGTKEISVIAIRHQEIQAVRRSFSMDSSNRNCVSIAGMLTMNHDIESVTGDCERGSLVVESPSNDIGEHSIFRNRLASSRSKILHNVRAQTIMKRSMSSGKFLFSRYGRGRNSILPL